MHGTDPAAPRNAQPIAQPAPALPGRLQLCHQALLSHAPLLHSLLQQRRLQCPVTAKPGVRLVHMQRKLLSDRCHAMPCHVMQFTAHDASRQGGAVTP